MAVEAWNPRTDPVPLHQWLFPWLEHLAVPLEELYPGIRQKLAAALTAWDPYDGSAKALLQPWHRVRALGQDLSAIYRRLTVGCILRALTPLPSLTSTHCATITVRTTVTLKAIGVLA